MKELFPGEKNQTYECTCSPCHEDKVGGRELEKFIRLKRQRLYSISPYTPALPPPPGEERRHPADRRDTGGGGSRGEVSYVREPHQV